MIRAYEEPERAGRPGPASPARDAARSADARKLLVAERVIGSAQGTWAELWAQLKPGVTPGGLVTPQMHGGFKPACGWPEFLEKLWLLKRYLDYTARLCEEPAGMARGA